MQLVTPAAEVGLAPVNASVSYMATLPNTTVTQGTPAPSTGNANTLTINESGLYSISFHAHTNVPTNSCFTRTSLFSVSGTYNQNRMQEGSGFSDTTINFVGQFATGDVIWFGVAACGTGSTAAPTTTNLYATGAGSEQSYIRITKVPIQP